MESEQIRCCRGGVGCKLCTYNNCNSEKGIIICENIECQCNQIHSKCILTHPLNDLLKTIQIKSHYYKQVIQSLLAWYDSGIKYLNTEKQNITKRIDQCSLILPGSQGMLYKRLYSKQYNLIKTTDVVTVLNAFYEHSKTDYIFDIQNIKRQSTKLLEELKQMSQKINKFQRLSIFNDKQMNVQTPMSEVMQLDKNLKFTNINVSSTGLVKTSATTDGEAQLILFSPPLTSKNQIQKHKFIIKSSSILFSNSILFGVCYQKKVKEKDYLIDLSTKNHGCYFLGNDQSVYSSHLLKKNYKSSFIQRFNQGKIIVQFNPLELQVSIATSYKTVNLKIKELKTDTLRLCVGVMSTVDVVQYLGEFI